MATLHYFMLFIYESEAQRSKVSPQTLTRLLPSVAAAKEWAQEEVDEYGGVGYLYKDTRQIAKIKAAKPNPRSRNGRSYIVRGETPKRYWEPSQGDVVYIEGTRTKLGRPYRDSDTGKTMFPLRPSVRGTTDMSAGNIKVIARVEAVSNPNQVHHSIGYPTKAQAEKAKRALAAKGGGPYKVHHAGGWWYVLGPKVGNPAAGPAAIPSRWTPATVSRKGGRIQIRIGRGR